MFFVTKRFICVALLFCFQSFLPSHAKELGSDLDISDLKPTFTQVFVGLPVLRNGTIADHPNQSLSDPEFEWNSAGRYVKASPRGVAVLTGLFKQPGMDWDPAQGAAFPNGDLIGMTGFSPYSIRDAKLAISVDRMPVDLLLFRPAGVTAEFLSGQLNSYPFVQRYGYFEARLKLPAGKGLLASFRLLPANGSWPPELGVMTMRGDETTSYFPSLHSKADGKQSTQTERVSSADLTADFHLFGMDWGPEKVGFYLDRKLVYEQPTPPDAHEAFYMILQLALGGPNSWFGSPDQSTPFPSSLSVDYIMVWQRPQYESNP